MMWLLFIGDMAVMAGMTLLAIWLFTRNDGRDAALIPLQDEASGVAPMPLHGEAGGVAPIPLHDEAKGGDHA